MKEQPLSFDELQLFNRRELIVRSVIAVPFAAIIWRLWDLQVKHGETFLELSKGNRRRLKYFAAPRGIIRDRNGIILAKNIPAYALMLVREDVPDIPLILRRISTTLKIPLRSLEEAIEKNSDTPKFQPIQIYEDLTMRQFTLIETYHEKFPGISVEVFPRRYYPLIKTGAHVFGYMSQISKPQLENLPRNKIMSAKLVGQEGIEAVYNEHLIGTDGGKHVEVNSTGREIRTISNPVEPQPGNDIILTINSKLQRETEKIMGDRQGSVIVMNPHNGEILSMVSMPEFDPNEFSQGFSHERWEELKNDPFHTLNNKCIQGGFSPGSTFKMITAAAALETGIIDANTEKVCEGHFRLGNTVMHCWKRSGHGSLSVIQALEQSCNIFFYKTAMELGIDKIKEFASRFGLGHFTGIDLLNENRGFIPDRKWKLKRFKKEWLKGETPNIAIGQGFLTVTPIQLLRYISAIANGGYLVTPRISQKIIDNKLLKENKNQKEEHRRILETKIDSKKVDILPDTIAIIKKGMELNVQGKKGTGVHAKSKIVPIAGKTGTTQVVSNKTREKIMRDKGEVEEKYFDHAWFTAFAPIENPIISIVVLIENGKSGRNAAGLAKKIIEYYFTDIASPTDPGFGTTPDTSSDIIDEKNPQNSV
ncbi:penicillin-binding protein 2 [bacterium]|nr:penicillin-binding protein 2 [bacterium]